MRRICFKNWVSEDDMKAEKMSAIMEDSEYCLAELGSLIKDIYFCKIPSIFFLNALSEENGEIRFHLPLYEVYERLGENSGSNCNANIISVNLETDILTDSEFLWEYPNLSNLVLTCTNSIATMLDDRDIKDMNSAIMNLTELKSLTFNISEMQDHPIKQIENFFYPPPSGIKVSFE